MTGIASTYLNLSTDNTLGGDSPSDSKAVSEKAIKEYVDNSPASGGANLDLSNLSATGEVHFQEPLVSGTNIKTINSNSLLGSGNIDIDSLPSQSGQSGKYLTTDGTDASWGTIDLSSKQDTLVSGTNIKTINSTTLLGSGNFSLVDTSSAQTVGGNKTFSSQPRIKTTGNDERILIYNNNYAQGTAPSAHQYGGYRFFDKNGVEMSSVYSRISTANVAQASLYVKSPVASSTSSSEIGIACNSSGTFYTWAPTPSTTDNSTKIATTAFVKNRISSFIPPNYSAGVSKSSGASAPANGWAVAYGNNANVNFTVNNVQVGQGNWWSGAWSGNWNIQIMVNSGDVCAGASWTFFPFKGA